MRCLYDQLNILASSYFIIWIRDRLQVTTSQIINYWLQLISLYHITIIWIVWISLIITNKMTMMALMAYTVSSPKWQEKSWVRNCQMQNGNLPKRLHFLLGSYWQPHLISNYKIKLNLPKSAPPPTYPSVHLLPARWWPTYQPPTCTPFKFISGTCWSKWGGDFFFLNVVWS